MTLATEIGIRLVAAEPRIGAAVFGAAFASAALTETARRVDVPVLFLLPWNDLEIDRESGLTLFDAFGSTEKTLHANPGPHQRVPWFEVEDSARFFSRHLSTTREYRPLHDARMSRDRRPEGDLMSEQTPEQTEDDEQSTPPSAEEYGSLTVEDNPKGTVNPADLAGTASESDDEVVYQPEHSEKDLDD